MSVAAVAPSHGTSLDQSAGRAQRARARTPRAIALLKQQPLATAGGAIVLLYIVAAVGAPWIAPFAPDRGDLLLRMAPPSFFPDGAPGHLLGADAIGRDLLSRIIWGARASLAIGVVTVVISAAVGVLLGCLAAFYRGLLDDTISRVAEFLMAFPQLIFAVGVMSVLGPGFWVIVAALAFKSWVEFFRLARAEILVERTREYAEAARALGASDLRVMARHLVPNILHTILVLATLRTGYFIIMEASLSFLGLGIQPPTPAWGGMVADGRSHMLDAWWIATFPGLALLLLVLALNSLGEGLRDMLDPRLRGTR